MVAGCAASPARPLRGPERLVYNRHAFWFEIGIWLSESRLLRLGAMELDR